MKVEQRITVQQGMKGQNWMRVEQRMRVEEGMKAE